MKMQMKMKSYRLPLAKSWLSHRRSHGRAMALLWLCYGSLMTLLWLSYGSVMAEL